MPLNIGRTYNNIKLMYCPVFWPLNITWYVTATYIKKNSA